MLLENSLKRGLLKSYPSIYYIQIYFITNILLLQIFLLFGNIKLKMGKCKVMNSDSTYLLSLTDNYLYLSKHFRINFKSLGLSKSIIISGYDIMAAIEL